MVKSLLHIWYSKYLKAVRRYISSTRSISFLPSTSFFHVSSMLLTLLQFLHVDYKVLSFDGSNLILVNALFEYFFVVYFFERGGFVLGWTISILLSLTLLSSSFFVLPSIYFFETYYLGQSTPLRLYTFDL